MPGGLAMAPIVLNQNDRLIALMGVTGVGKSSFIQQFTDEDVGIGEDLESFTTNVAIYPCKMPGTEKKFYLVDTPGFDDSSKSDHTILRELSSWLTKTYSEQIKLSGIVYLHRIMDVRLGGAAVRNLNMFKKLCGDGELASVVLATTFWSEVDAEIGEARELQLKSTRAFWGAMIDKGSQVLRHDNGAKSGAAIVQYLLDRQEQVVYAIQKEMVDDHKTLEETAAGGEVQAEMEKLRRKYEQELRELQREMQEELAKRDKETREQLQKERQERQAWIDRELTERKKMQADADELWKQREREREQERREHVKNMEGLQKQLVEVQTMAKTAQADKEHQAKMNELEKQIAREEAKNRELERSRFTVAIRGMFDDIREFIKSL